MANDLQAEQQLFVDTPARRAVRRFSRHRLAMLGLGVLLIMVTLAVLAPAVAPHSPTKQELILYRKPPHNDALAGHRFSGPRRVLPPDPRRPGLSQCGAGSCWHL